MTDRIVCQFSCGAASAVATKLAIAQFGEVEIINAFVQEEHPDNQRFLADCERWFGKNVTVLRNANYGASIIEVFKRVRFMKGPSGASCSTRLKRELLNGWLRPDDAIVIGFTAEEQDRFDDLCERMSNRKVIAPLIERGLGKDDCKAMIERAGIKLPVMYRLGYRNANCRGCVKGGEGYFRAIREDFPAQFEILAKMQDELGPGSYFFLDRKTGERKSLRQLGAGKVDRSEHVPSCSFFCEIAEKEYAP